MTGDAASGSGGEIELDNVGKCVILPSTFIGGQCHVAPHYQDAMALARYFGKIDYFIAMTAYPNWKEIVDALLPDQKSSDHPDLVAYIFHQMQQFSCIRL